MVQVGLRLGLWHMTHVGINATTEWARTFVRHERQLINCRGGSLIYTSICREGIITTIREYTHTAKRVHMSLQERTPACSSARKKANTHHYNANQPAKNHKAGCIVDLYQ